ncbi:DUF2087 domain-containing protein [Homoserinibacter sp. YIM 151385]|uniref:DUF2087 domain-containing protein n=1 Tax=Homoserinibacter sp. YIM 151385 TaxID=2985506 RepID=UPI0022EFE3CD|nr:DUF2087 domain-containing protein [Homoserinibacter sp. YIM 151385]WBU37054.1 DUF2087 domain-containing protein [Homoserinibacter sp. YIM 151385]
MPAGAIRVLGALADPARLRCLAALQGAVPEGLGFAALAAELGMPESRVRKLVAVLAGAGLVEPGRAGVVAVAGAVAAAREAALAELPLGSLAAEEPRLRTVAPDGIVERLPVDAALRRELTERIAAVLPRFERASEDELMTMLAPITTDPALVRRELVDQGLLERSADGAEYRRP